MANGLWHRQWEKHGPLFVRAIGHTLLFPPPSAISHQLFGPAIRDTPYALVGASRLPATSLGIRLASFRRIAFFRRKR